VTCIYHLGTVSQCDCKVRGDQQCMCVTAIATETGNLMIQAHICVIVLEHLGSPKCIYDFMPQSVKHIGYK